MSVNIFARFSFLTLTQDHLPHVPIKLLPRERRQAKLIQKNVHIFYLMFRVLQQTSSELKVENRCNNEIEIQDK